MLRSAGTSSTTAHHSRLNQAPADGRIFQLPASSRSRSSSGSDSSQVKYSGLTRSRTGLSNTFAGMKVTLIGLGGSMPGGRSSGRGRARLNSLGFLGPPSFFSEGGEVGEK